MKQKVFWIVLLCASIAIASTYQTWKGQSTVTMTTALGTGGVTVTKNIMGGRLNGARSANGFLKVGRSDVERTVADSTASGIGVLDTCVITLYTTLGEFTKVLKADTCKGATGLPCSSYYAIPQLTGDTALKEAIYWEVRIGDTMSDSVFSANYPVWYQFQAK